MMINLYFINFGFEYANETTKPILNNTHMYKKSLRMDTIQ